MTTPIADHIQAHLEKYGFERKNYPARHKISKFEKIVPMKSYINTNLIIQVAMVEDTGRGNIVTYVIASEDNVSLYTGRNETIKTTDGWESKVDDYAKTLSNDIGVIADKVGEQIAREFKIKGRI